MSDKNLHANDEILEAIKHEDFLNKLKSLLPILALGAILLLAGTIGYVIWQNRHEKSLYEAESAYKKVLVHIEKGEFSEAKKALGNKDLKENKGFETLANLQMAHLFQQDFHLTASRLSEKQVKEVYQRLIQERKSIATECFLATAQAFLSPEILSTPEGAEVKKFFTKGHSFYDAGLILKALHAYQDPKNTKYLREAFLQWEEENPPATKWLPAYCAIGLGLERPLPSKPE